MFHEINFYPLESFALISDFLLYPKEVNLLQQSYRSLLGLAYICIRFPG